MQTFSFPDNHIIVSSPTEKQPVIRVWMRTRIVFDTPLEAPKVPEVPKKRISSSPLPEPEATDPAAVALLALLVILGWAWYTERDIVRLPPVHGKTRVDI